MIWNWLTFIRGVSEFSATCLLMLFGCMGEAMNKESDSVIASLHYGLAVMVIMHIYGFVSGAHANPCVSIACYYMGYIVSEMLVLYVVCQLAGGLVGYYLLLQLLPKEVIDNSKPGVCLVEPMNGLSNLQIVGIEGLLTSVLVLGWCALWDVRNGRFLDSVSIRMGLLVTACSFAGVQLTGASMNPAKTLVPSIFLGSPDEVLLQLAGQILASILVPFIWKNAYMPRYKPLEIPLSPCPGYD
ncbi:hypothetical protein KR009_007889 [Drosophila setifemur]|nr:hypothetical protein KR009_007889 [Drosophila setifemur]